MTLGGGIDIEEADYQVRENRNGIPANLLNFEEETVRGRADHTCPLRKPSSG